MQIFHSTLVREKTYYMFFEIKLLKTSTMESNFFKNVFKTGSGMLMQNLKNSLCYAFNKLIFFKMCVYEGTRLRKLSDVI